jgi:hypothetical protein
MSEWRVRHHYGFGAARVALSPAPHFVPDRALSLGSAMRDAGWDFYLDTLPPLVIALFAFAALFLTVAPDRGHTDLEVAMIARDMLEPEEEEIAPPPVEELVQEIPEPQPEPVPEPPPPVEKLAVKKPAEPLPPKAPEKPPEPVRQVARVKPPPRPAPKPAPRPQIDAIAKAAPVEKPLPPPPVRRGNQVREQVMPKLALAPVAPAPDFAELPEDSGSRRFASVRAPAPVARPKADLGPPIAARPLSAPAPEPPPARTRRPAPGSEASARPALSPVAFAAAAPMPAAPAPAAPGPRSARPVAPTTASRSASPNIKPGLSAVAPAALRSESAVSSHRAPERDRSERNASSQRRRDHSGGRDLAVVPLASLASCVSEQEEEALKRRLVAAVTTQSECVSRAGTYRFVETKNLNAFLMTIERAPGRPVADRCVELSHALACVAR